MKVKPVLTKGMPPEVVKAMSSSKFACWFLDDVVAGALGVTNPIGRPGEFYMQEPDFSVDTGGGWGVELRLTGVSRSGRKAKQFHEAVRRMHFGAKSFLEEALLSAGSSQQIHLFTVLMLDGDIETAPGSGAYSNVLESPAEWVHAVVEESTEAAPAASGEETDPGAP